MFDLNKRRVLITGASSGIGSALARELANHGCRLFLVARRLERLEALARDLDTTGVEVGYAWCDVADESSVRQAARQLEEQFGGVDVVILNAGIGGRFDVRNFRAADVEQVIKVNYLGAVYWLEHTLPYLVKQQAGAVVGISSLAAVRGLPGSGAYSASKAALSTFLESLRLELRPLGIHVLTVEPGFVRTEMTAGLKSMPFMLEAGDAARRIVRALRRRRAVLRFPLVPAAAMRLIGLLPVAVYDLTMGRIRTWE